MRQVLLPSRVIDGLTERAPAVQPLREFEGGVGGIRRILATTQGRSGTMVTCSPFSPSVFANRSPLEIAAWHEPPQGENQ
jgi:hypothetical protein